MSNVLSIKGGNEITLNFEKDIKPEILKKLNTYKPAMQLAIAADLLDNPIRSLSYKSNEYGAIETILHGLDSKNINHNLEHLNIQLGIYTYNADFVNNTLKVINDDEKEVLEVDLKNIPENLDNISDLTKTRFFEFLNGLYANRNEMSFNMDTYMELDNLTFNKTRKDDKYKFSFLKQEDNKFTLSDNDGQSLITISLGEQNITPDMIKDIIIPSTHHESLNTKVKFIANKYYVKEITVSDCNLEDYIDVTNSIKYADGLDGVPINFIGYSGTNAQMINGMDEAKFNMNFENKVNISIRENEHGSFCILEELEIKEKLSNKDLEYIHSVLYDIDNISDSFADELVYGSLDKQKGYVKHKTNTGIDK